MAKDDAIRLRHMLDAAHEARSFARGRCRADLDRVWDTVVDDLPPLISQLEAALSES